MARLVSADGRVVGERVELARSARSRAKGLLGRDVAAGLLLLEPARQVHTMGMRFPIDVAFCDREGRVVHLIRGLKPWRLTRWVGSARRVVEASAGGLAGVSVGDRLTVEED